MQLLDERIDASFVDVNMGCPIDLVCDKGAGSALLTKWAPRRSSSAARPRPCARACPACPSAAALRAPAAAECPAGAAPRAMHRAPG